MDPLYVIGAILLSSTTNIFGGFYNRACRGAKSSSQFYNCIQLICVCLCWGIAFLIDRNFNVAVLPYSLGFSAGYCVAVFGVINALRTGPVMLTTLLTVFRYIFRLCCSQRAILILIIKARFMNS